jgi:hypothetical protein
MLAIKYGFHEIEFSPWKGYHPVFGFRGTASSPTKYNGILMPVHGIFLIGGTFKSQKLTPFQILSYQKHCFHINQCESAVFISHA